MSLSSTTIFHLLDIILSNDIDYSGLIFFLYHISSAEIVVKLEVAKRLLQTVFVKPNSSQQIAKQIGWQECIARLLIRKPISLLQLDDEEERRKSFGINADVILDNTNDLISFTEEALNAEIETTLNAKTESNEIDGQIMNEIQASVTEAATVIEAEIKGIIEFNIYNDIKSYRI